MIPIKKNGLKRLQIIIKPILYSDLNARGRIKASLGFQKALTRY